MKKHILVVDNNFTDLKIIEKMLSDHYKVTILVSGNQALKFLQNTKPDLILLNITMIGMTGYEVVVNIKRNYLLSDIPVILMSSYIDVNVELYGIELGVVDFFRKPIIPRLALSKIKLHLDAKDYQEELEGKVAEKTQIIETLQDVMILSLAELVECRDENTGGHVKRTATYVKILTEELMKRGLYEDILTEEYAHDVIRSAPLHDVGKIGISDATLLKNDSLDKDEFEFMKQHATLGAIALQKMIDETNAQTFLYIAKEMAYYHHEKWNGTGYPTGLKGEQIPVCARIMAIGDVYDALTTKRPYKEPFSHEEVTEIILNGRGINFDPVIVDVFGEIHNKFKDARILI